MRKTLGNLCVYCETDEIMNKEQREKSFRHQKTLAKAVSKVKSFGAYHHTYCCYTTIDRVGEMLNSAHPCMWLTRLDAGLFDDGIEHSKYGYKKDRSRTYIKSFIYGSQENAGMWGLYCPPTYKAIRLAITKTGMEALRHAKCVRLRGGKCSSTIGSSRLVLSDIIYASVRDDETGSERSNCLFWNGVYTGVIKGLEKSKEWKCATGFVKDAEWRFENEFRLNIKTDKTYGSHIAIMLPPEFINGLSFTLSPWADKDELLFVKGKLCNWLKKSGRLVASEDSKVFRKSVLSRGLKEWAKRRGL